MIRVYAALTMRLPGFLQIKGKKLAQFLYRYSKNIKQTPGQICILKVAFAS